MNVTPIVRSPDSTSPRAAEPAVNPVPDNPFKALSNRGMAVYLNTNFSRFADPKQPGVVTRESLETVARSGSQEVGEAHFSKFALALLGNSGLMEKLARGGDINRASVAAFIHPQNGHFSSKSDLDLTWHLLNNFSTFSKPHTFVVGRNASETENVVTRDTLQRVKNSNSSSRYTSEHRLFASELLLRSSLAAKILDGLGGSGFVNMISYTVLNEWLTLGNRSRI